MGEKELSEGQYTIEVELSGGSGRAEIDSPTELFVKKDEVNVRLTWSSPNYDYMIVEGKKYLPENEDGNSSFLIPVTEFDRAVEVTADTTAMSTPHEITYTLFFDSSTIQSVSGDARATEPGEPAENHERTKREDLEDGEVPEIDGLTYTDTVILDYAECFQIYHYEDGYSVIRVDDGRDYMIVPEGKDVPDGLPESFIILKKPLDSIYLAASAVMSLFDSADALDSIRFSGLDADAWYIENAKKAMEERDILFAGKYSAPDYELLLDKGCDLSVESTMILHAPEVLEKLEALGIPVLIDRSSYEPEPLGRTEWIRLYGELTGKAKEAESYFEEQKKKVEALTDFENTGQTVAFFYINHNGMIVTRKSSDYLVKMMEDAGGEYVFELLGEEESVSSNVTMSMEEFYAMASSADYLVYNATVGESVDSIEELLEKERLFSDFKAVKDGNVWCMGKYLYQATNEIGSLTAEFHTMLTDQHAEELTSMKRLQ